MSVAPRVTPTLVQALLMACWLGAAILFAGVVARAAFAVLPTRALAGALVGRVLPVLFYSGLLLSVVAALLERGGVAGRGVMIALGTVTGVCLLAQVVIGARIQALRDRMPGPIDALDVADPLRVAFGRMHALSVGCLGVAIAAALVSVVLSARAISAAQTLPRP
ncbi:MAG: DUF4149 domain-containing protein [Gemmatimonadaceae bacterium]